MPLYAHIGGLSKEEVLSRRALRNLWTCPRQREVSGDRHGAVPGVTSGAACGPRLDALYELPPRLKLWHEATTMGPVSHRCQRPPKMNYKLPLVLTPQVEGGHIVTSPLLPELVTEGDSVAMCSPMSRMRSRLLSSSMRTWDVHRLAAPGFCDYADDRQVVERGACVHRTGWPTLACPPRLNQRGSLVCPPPTDPRASGYTSYGSSG